VPALLEVLRRECPDPEIVSKAMSALESIGRDTVPPLIEPLRGEDARVQCLAAQILGRIGRDAREAVPALIALLPRGDSDARSAAAEALVTIGPEARDAVPPLIERLRGEDAGIQSNAAQILGSLGPEARQAVPPLIERLQRGDRDARRAAAALGRIGPEARAAVPALIELLQHWGWEARHAAAAALGEIGPEARQAVPALVERLRHRNPDARRDAAVALDRIVAGSPYGLPAAVTRDLVPPLIELLRGEDAGVWSTAARILGLIGPEAGEAVPDLIQLLQRGDSDDRSDAAVALDRIVAGSPYGLPAAVTRDLVPPLIELLRGEDAGVWGPAARILGKIGPEARQAVPALIELLQRGDRDARDAAWALGGIGPEARAAVPALIELLQRGDRDARKDAAVALGRIGGQVAVAALLEVLEGAVPDPEVVSNAMRVLSDIGREVVPPLIELLGAEDAGVRTAARILALMDLTEIDLAALRLIKAGAIDINGVSKKIPNIRLLRDRTGCGLKQAKESVEKMMALGDDTMQRLIEKLT
jgi:HEAT repeat protein